MINTLVHFQYVDTAKVFEQHNRHKNMVREFTKLIDSPIGDAEGNVQKWIALTKHDTNITALAQALEKFSYDDIAELIFVLMSDVSETQTVSEYDIQDIEDAAYALREKANDLRDIAMRLKASQREGGAE